MASADILHSLKIIMVAISMLLIFIMISVVSSSGAIPNYATFTADYQATNMSKILAIFVFGDSTVDPGNNNFLLTTFKGDFPPYGRDFPGSQPTGRFTDGRLVTDFIASYVGLKDYIPPYLDPTLSLEELKTGVSFASAGSGFDPATAKISNVLPISKQMENFREYRSKMEKVIGKREMSHIIEHSIFAISVGTNDFAINYFVAPLRRISYTVSEYQNYLLSQLQQLIQELLKEGAKKIGVVGLPPMGCLPILITIFSEDRFAGRECIESFSSVAREYNEMVMNALSSKIYESEGLTIAYADIYTPLNLIFQNPKMFGFEEVRKGCCGTGVVEASFLCNPKSHLCSDVSKYAFFDSIHPTEKTYNILFESFKPKIDSALQGT